MIRLLALGTLELFPDATELRAVLSQPKRTALLVYLAAARPQGFHRRDRLLSLFWPEMDEDRARAALSNTVYHLRRALGKDAVQSRGAEELALGAEVWSDVAEFHRRLEAGDYSGALEVYRGPLLHGFFLDAASEFERWLEQERDALQRRAADAARLATEEAEQAGDIAVALRYAHQSVAISTDAELALQRLLELLERSGDRAGAVRAFNDFARTMREEYELEPSAETVAIAERIRANPPLIPAQTPLAGPIASAPAAASAVALPLRSAQPRSVVTGKRRRVGWVVALLVLGTAAAWGVWPRAPAAAAASRIAIFPFAVHGSDELAYLGEGLATLLGTTLDEVGELRTVDSRSVLRALGNVGSVEDHQQAARLASAFGAKFYVLGDILTAGDEVRITAALYETARGDEPVTRADAAGHADQVFELVDRLTNRVLTATAPEAAGHLVRAAALTTRSPAAFKAFLIGERRFRGGDFAGAVEAFERAVAEDTAFALAYYRLAIAADWAGEAELVRENAAHAARLSDRLTPRNRQLVRALLAWRRGDATEAERLYRDFTRINPEDVEAWHQLGEVLYHLNPARGRSIREAREPFERVLALHPNHTGALAHLARIVAGEGDYDALDSLVARGRAMKLNGSAVELDLLQAFSRRDSVRIEHALRALAEADDVTLFNAPIRVAVHTRNLDGAARMLRLVTAPHHSEVQRSEAYARLAYVALASGRWREADAHLQRLDALKYKAGVERRSMLAAFPFTPIPPVEIERLRNALRSWMPSGSARSVPDDDRIATAADVDEIAPSSREYLLARLALRLADHRDALERADRLEEMSEVPEVRDLARVLAAGIRAEVTWKTRNAASALSIIEQTEAELSLDALNSAIGTLGLERWTRAELLRETGREEEALRWYATLPESSFQELIYLAPSHLRQAEIYERRGDTPTAILHYRRFIELWAECDPELRPLVREAETRLARLKS